MNTNTAEVLEDFGPWKFSEAPEEVRQKAIESWRDEGIDYGWWDFTFADFKEDMAEKGIQVDEIYFRLSYSQGDYAACEGCISDIEKYLDKHYAADAFPTIRTLLKLDGAWGMSWEYSDYYGMQFSSEGDEWEDIQPYDENDLRYHCLNTIMANADDEDTELFNDVKEQIKRYCRKLYKDLESEYDYLMSDEAIAETMEANDYTIDEDGEII